MSIDIYIGIDSGTHTGFAVWNKRSKVLDEVKTLKIHTAILNVLEMHQGGSSIMVRVEDARKATFNRRGVTDMHKQQGAGSVKRDAVIWEDFLKEYGISYEMVRPSKAITKLGKYEFEKLTCYRGITSTHGRDAAMLVYGL